ncbi:MAG TPA: peptidylprolyl isomerase [Puia sp.]|nr:peptidylprolyl isomerase [Puia sp.]
MKAAFRRFFSSPLLHFLVAGFIIFITSYYIAKRRQTHRIVIDKAVVEKLIASWQMQFGKMPTDRELKIATDDWVKQEVLFREAESLGLNQDDEIIKRRLQQKMSFILKDNLVVPEPGPATLEEYYKKNASKFYDPPKVSFTHIYFSADKTGTEKAKQRADSVLQKLMKASSHRAPEMGDRFMLLYDYNDVNKTDVGGLFGDSQFTDTLFAIKENQWAGPFLSGYGWHLVFVNKRLQTSLAPLNEIKERVLESYKNDKLTEMDNEAIENLIEKYTIEVKTN